MPPTTPPGFQLFASIYKPSAIQRLPDGRFLFVEDEKVHFFSLLNLAANGDASTKSLGSSWFRGGNRV